eukprot:1159792-Pelagomonas_calceolata.AAC.13
MRGPVHKQSGAENAEGRSVHIVDAVGAALDKLDANKPCACKGGASLQLRTPTSTPTHPHTHTQTWKQTAPPNAGPLQSASGLGHPPTCTVSSSSSHAHLVPPFQHGRKALRVFAQQLQQERPPVQHQLVDSVLRSNRDKLKQWKGLRRQRFDMRGEASVGNERNSMS